MKRIHTVVLRLCALVALGPAALAAQGVLVAPTGIFIDSHTRGGSVELYNPGADPVEVSISTAFGYPVSDSLGRITLYLDSAPGAGSTVAVHVPLDDHAGSARFVSAP